MDKILVLDFGGQYNQLIARRVRENNIYAEIRAYDRISVDEIREKEYKGIIFTGGPNSVYDESSPHFDPAFLDLNIPVLGICYGCQLIAYMRNGIVSSAENSSEYGKTRLHSEDNPLFHNMPSESICWMSHHDYIQIISGWTLATLRGRFAPQNWPFASAICKNREEQILQEFVSYIPLGSIGRIANELIEENGLSENFPMLVVMPDKYDYLEGIDPKE